MTNKNTLTENELAFLELVRTADSDGMEIISKILLCVAKFGDEFLNDIKEGVVHEDRDAILSIVDDYISRLEGVR